MYGSPFLSCMSYYTPKMSRDESKWDLCPDMGMPLLKSAGVKIKQFVTEVGLDFQVALNQLFTIGFKWCEDRRKTFFSELESRVPEGFICLTSLFSNFYRCKVSQLVSCLSPALYPLWSIQWGCLEIVLCIFHGLSL